MATVVTIMDRPTFRARTDVIVVVDAEQRRLLWVPRDLWTVSIGDRINEAYALGGHPSLVAALAEHGVAAEHGLCIGREAAEAGLADVEITMPVERTMEFWYPLSPTERIQDGRKLIRFTAPVEKLKGERLHQWLGARHAVDPFDEGDIFRIRRQQQILTVALAEGFGFDRFVAPGLSHEIAGEPFGELRQVTADWSFETFGPTRLERIGDKIVLVSET